MTENSSLLHFCRGDTPGQIRVGFTNAVSYDDIMHPRRVILTAGSEFLIDYLSRHDRQLDTLVYQGLVRAVISLEQSKDEYLLLDRIHVDGKKPTTVIHEPLRWFAANTESALKNIACEAGAGGRHNPYLATSLYFREAQPAQVGPILRELDAGLLLTGLPPPPPLFPPPSGEYRYQVALESISDLRGWPHGPYL